MQQRLYLLYRITRFTACLWPTPLWVYNNDVGGGFNTHNLETIEIRELMKELGIKNHFVSFLKNCIKFNNVKII